MKTYLAVAAGSVIGSAARWIAGLGLVYLSGPETIFAALFVNLTGSFLIGVLGARRDASVLWRAFAMTGLCGGYTTFSAFSLDTLRLLQGGALSIAAAYVGATLTGSIFAVWLGETISAPKQV
jgi:CrcB protein